MSRSAGIRLVSFETGSWRSASTVTHKALHIRASGGGRPLPVGTPRAREAENGRQMLASGQQRHGMHVPLSLSQAGPRLPLLSRRSGHNARDGLQKTVDSEPYRVWPSWRRATPSSRRCAAPPARGGWRSAGRCGSGIPPAAHSRGRAGRRESPVVLQGLERSDPHTVSHAASRDRGGFDSLE